MRIARRVATLADPLADPSVFDRRTCRAWNPAAPATAQRWPLRPRPPPQPLGAARRSTSHGRQSWRKSGGVAETTAIKQNVCEFCVKQSSFVRFLKVTIGILYRVSRTNKHTSKHLLRGCLMLSLWGSNETQNRSLANSMCVLVFFGPSAFPSKNQWSCEQAEFRRKMFKSEKLAI